VACCLSAGFVLVRKPGKLPHKRVAMSYAWNYGQDTLEMHADAIVKGSAVIVDDVLARRHNEGLLRSGGSVGRRTGRDRVLIETDGAERTRQDRASADAFSHSILNWNAPAKK